MNIVKKEKKSLITSNVYYLMSGGRSYSFKGHKEHDQYIIITLKNDGGYIEFEFVNSSFNNGNKFVNPATGTYTFPLRKEEKYHLFVRATRAKGAFKVEKLTVKKIFKK